MNWSEVQTNWEQLTALLRSRWHELTDDDLESIEGDRDSLVALLQKRYGFTKESAHREVCEFEKDVRYPGAVK